MVFIAHYTQKPESAPTHTESLCARVCAKICPQSCLLLIFGSLVFAVIGLSSPAESIQHAISSAILFGYFLIGMILFMVAIVEGARNPSPAQLVDLV